MPTLDKSGSNKASKGAEEILLTQIKQEFTTPAEAIFDYLELVEKNLSELNLVFEDELLQIKNGAEKLIEQYEDAFKENTGPNATKQTKSPEEYSTLRHNLRTPLNAIIGYSEILLEDTEEDASEELTSDISSIIDLSRETEKAIEKFVDYIRGALSSDSSGELETAEALFKSLGSIDYSLEIDENLQNSDILIVDDNKTNCEVLERRLSLQGLKCRTSYDGNSAIEEVKKKVPDLILLDVILPDVNGLELLKLFREDHSRDDLPVIMVSAFNDVDSIAKCIQLGAQDYLPKPLNGTILLAKVISSLERKFFRERERELVNELHIQATTDQLTGIFNRRVVFDSLEKAYDDLVQGNSKGFSVLTLDIDFFKKINDTYGHSGGDEVLKSFAKNLNDTISKPNIVGRIGGEEFLAILMETDQKKIVELCNDLRNEITKKSVTYEGEEIKVTFSGGTANTSETRNASDLVNKADERLYDAKKSGRDKIVFPDK
jgi:diguanylate cyclase (GGDEF)-like protein